MRYLGFVAGLLFFFVNSAANAQGWFEYTNREEQFSVNFPEEPAIGDVSYKAASGQNIPARLFEAREGASRYTVTVVNYTGAAPEDIAAAIDHAAETYRDSGSEVTYDNEAGVDGIDGHMVQLTNPDGGRSFVQISFLFDRLFIVDATVPAGSIIPGHFQQSLVMLDEQGRRVRYQRNENGERYRVVPGGGGEPLVE